MKSYKALKHHKHFIILTIIIILASFLRLYTLGSESLWSDEIRQVNISSPDASFGSVIHEATRQQHPPLDYLLLHLIRSIKTSDFMVRLPSAIYGILSIIAIYLLATSMFSYKEGLISAFLLSISCFHIAYSQEARPFSLTMLFAILSIWVFYKAITIDKIKYWILFSVITLLAVYTHSFFLLIMFVELLVIFFLFFIKSRILQVQPDLISIKKIGKVIVCLIIIFICFAPVLRIVIEKQYADGYIPYANFSPIKRFTLAIHSYSIEPLKKTLFAIGSAMPRAFLFLSVIGIFTSFKKKYVLETTLIIFFLIVFPLLVLFMFHFVGNLRIEPRYMIFILPIYLIAACRGIMFVSESLKYLFDKIFNFKAVLVENIFLLFFVLSIGSFHITPLLEHYRYKHKQDWRSLTEYVDTYVPLEDRLMFNPGWLINNYLYYSKNYLRKLDSPFLRNRWWITAHGAKPVDLKDGEVFKLIKEFTGGVYLWTVDGKEQIRCEKFLKIFPGQIKNLRTNVPDNSIIYINLINFMPACPDLESLLTNAVQNCYHKSTVQVRDIGKFDGLKSNRHNLFFDSYEGLLTEATDEVLSAYEKYRETYCDRSWDFEENTIRAWKIDQLLEPLGIEKGIWRLKSTGNDPQIRGPQLDIPTNMVEKYEFRLNITAAVKKGTAQLFWITANDRIWGENNKWINIELIQDGEFHTYSVDLLNSSRFVKKEGDRLIELRFDPAVMVANIEIDYIKLSLLKPSSLLKSIFFNRWQRNVKGI